MRHSIESELWNFTVAIQENTDRLSHVQRL